MNPVEKLVRKILHDHELHPFRDSISLTVYTNSDSPSFRIEIHDTHVVIRQASFVPYMINLADPSFVEKLVAECKWRKLVTTGYFGRKLND